MKASELRLDNYIEYNGMVKSVYSINMNSFVTFKTETITVNNIEYNQSPSLHISNFNPIQLTEEWLLNFGFVNENKMFIKSYSRNEDNMVSFLGIFFEEKMNAWIGYVGNNSTNFSVAINCYFSVHQLQNLYFYLTGEELTLKTE